MDRAYAAAYAHLFRHHWWWRAREGLLLAEIGRLSAGCPLRILDVGCGAGLFFDALERFGTVDGLECDASLIAQAGRWRDRITEGSLTADFAPPQPYDLILLLDVLEHLPQPDAALARARQLLAPGGTLLVTVPALPVLWTSHDVLNAHRTRYTRRRLQQVLAASGWQVERLQYLFASLVLPKLLLRLLEGTSGIAAAPPRVPPRWLNTAMRRICAADLRLRSVWPVGSSLLAVARPTQPVQTPL